jgi:Ca2+-binding RTX toxin-like protein
MAAFEEGGAQGLLYVLTKGDDKVVGSKEGDYLLGGAGDDVLTGGKGSDFFEFQERVMMESAKASPQHDVITDFDTKGEDADGLQYVGEFDLKGTHQGKDTLLTFAYDSTLLLEGVKKSEFQDWLDNQATL